MIVKTVGDLIAEIASASGEQASEIDQVGAAITQMDELTQQNTPQVVEAAAPCQVLAEQSESLSELMRRYRVSADAGSSAAVVADAAGAEAKPRATRQQRA